MKFSAVVLALALGAASAFAPVNNRAMPRTVVQAQVRLPCDSRAGSTRIAVLGGSVFVCGVACSIVLFGVGHTRPRKH